MRKRSATQSIRVTMDELSRKWRSIDWKGLQKSARRMQASTASALKDMVMTDLENSVRAATADTSWGASGTDLMAIAQATYNREDYALIMSIVWQRLTSSRWRCVYKGLDLLRHLIMHGSARCAEEARSAVTHIQSLENFRYVDSKTMKDEGANVRAKAQLVVAMLTDADLLEEEREKSKALRAKLAGGTSMSVSGRPGGMSSDDYRYGGAVEERPNVTTSSAGRYAGYDDDDELESGAYDAQPNAFAAKFEEEKTKSSSSHMANVDDLLGGGASVWDDATDAVEADKGGQVEQPSYVTTDTEDLFSMLALTNGDDKTAATVQVPQQQTEVAAQVPTSLLIQKLAAEKTMSVGKEPVAAATVTTAATPSDANGLERSTAHTDERQEDGAVERVSVAVTRAPLTRKQDNDPFGDLLATAKQSGVL